jgi:hypothetical protein
MSQGVCGKQAGHDGSNWKNWKMMPGLVPRQIAI